MAIINKSSDTVNPILKNFFSACGGYGQFKSWEIGAISELADALIGHNLWEKMVAIYPFVGRTAASHSLNIKNTSKYSITWSGTLTHDQYGVTGGGGKGLTNIPLNLFSGKEDNIHLSAYNRTNISNSTSDGRLIGVNSMKLLPNVRDIGSQEINFSTVGGIVGYIYGEYSYDAGIGRATSDLSGVTGKGIFIANCSSACYLNGSAFGSQFALPPAKIHAACPRTIILFGNRYELSMTSAAHVNLAFSSVGYGLSSNDIKNLTNIVETFQKAMFRSAM